MSRQHRRYLLTALAGAAIVSCAPSDPRAAAPKTTVLRIIDGDTIVTTAPGGQETIRIIGIDTPETYGGLECGGRAATDEMWKLAPPGQTVTLQPDPTQDKRDRYKRLLAYVRTKPEGRKTPIDVGHEQIRLGHSRAYVYRKPFARLASYQDAERVARTRGRGVWGVCGGNFHQET